jgi:hypothetical protein
MSTASLSQDAKRLLAEAGCPEVADDHILIGEGVSVMVPLSRRAIAELNRQAFDRWVDMGMPKAQPWTPPVRNAALPAGDAP